MGKYPAHQKIKTFISQTQARRLQSRQNSLVFFSCLSFFFTLAISRNFSSSFSTVAPPGGNREQQLGVFKYCNGIKFVQVINGLGEGKTHCLFAQLSRQITTEYTSLSSAHTNFPDFFFLPFGSATWRPIIEHYNFLLFT